MHRGADVVEVAGFQQFGGAQAAPGGGGDFLFVAQIAAIAGGELRLDAVDGSAKLPTWSRLTSPS